MRQTRKIKDNEPLLKWPREFFFEMKEASDTNDSGYLEPHSHNMYVISILYEGILPHYADFEQKPIKAPAILALNPDQIHIHASKAGCKICSLAFAPDFVQSDSKEISAYILTIFSQFAVPLSNAELEHLDTYIQLIRKEYDKGELCNTMIIKMLLNVIIIQSHHVITKSSTIDKPREDLYYRFLHLIKRKGANTRTVLIYAKELNVSADVLNQVVRQNSSKTPKQIIDQHLLLEAKRMLYWTEKTIRETSWELGFETDSYFNRFFKKFTGITPKQFRDQRSK